MTPISPKPQPIEAPATPNGRGFKPLAGLRRWWRGTREIAAFFRAGLVALAAFFAGKS